MSESAAPPKPGDRPRIWFDVEDLFHYAARNARPTGIQRVCYEIYCAAMADPAIAARVGFLRHATVGRGFVEADWDELELLFRRVTDRQGPAEPTRPAPPVLPEVAPAGAEAHSIPDPDPDASSSVGQADPAARGGRLRPLRLVRQALQAVPERVRRPAILFAVMQAQAASSLAATVGWSAVGVARAGGRAGWRGLGQAGASLSASRRPKPEVVRELRRLDDIARRGDILAVLGSPWFELDYAELAAHVRGRLGMRLAVLLHDVIPVRRPEWVDRGTTRVYRDWYTAVLPLADAVFANSRATAADVMSWCRRDNIALTARVTPLPLGTGFGAVDGSGQSAPGQQTLPPELARMLEGRPYVLFVSTIEARKNHMLLFRVWRRLMEEMPADRLPDLVFAGKVGWMVRDLMDQIDNSQSLGGRLHVIEGLDDDQLRAVYAGCLFTVFPSYYEGWGLPVSESLAAGKPCICSNTTSLPEAGGTLARYFDPSDLNDATRVIADAVDDRAGLTAWTAEIRRSFRLVGWRDTVSALVGTLDRLG